MFNTDELCGRRSIPSHEAYGMDGIHHIVRERVPKPIQTIFPTSRKWS